MPQFLQYRAEDRLLGRVGIDPQRGANLRCRTILHVPHNKRRSLGRRKNVRRGLLHGTDLAAQ